MQTNSQAELEIQGPASIENVLMTTGDLIISSSSLLFEDPQEPVDDNQKPAKKQTRQWAAWTRQEEENFFNALRQVGKDFEKITGRVRSKNKNQVRYYYYRLVRRMNKLLGPGLSLDAKNSKDTIAAMLRWWNLLEKFSFSGKKLHLKPRRFKTFVEALENQLLKDRKKTRRKRPCHDERLVTSSTTSILSKTPVNDSQNTHKIGAAKRTSSKRNVSPNGYSSTIKTVRQKRRSAIGSAEYKKWEKAAKAGVSLVADAAEELERAANNRKNSFDRGSLDVLSSQIHTTAVEMDVGFVERAAFSVASPTLPGVCSHQIGETIVQSFMKLKLQLFPIDEGTCKLLEKDAHNPHLELTLSAKKRISSVLEHLNRKWGKSSTCMGELVLFPYNIQQGDLPSCPRWGIKDADATMADVYAAIGAPSIFRLRYGWFSSTEVGPTPPTQFNDLVARTADVDSTKLVDSSKDQPISAVNLGARNGATLSALEWADSLTTTISVGDLLLEASRACVNSSTEENVAGLQQISFSCDSFDDAVAAHVTGFQLPSLSKGGEPHASIWNDEETCDAFSFQNIPSFKGESSKPFSPSGGTGDANSLGLHGYFKDLHEPGPPNDPPCRDPKTNPEYVRELVEDTGHTDIFWPDSLGLGDLDTPLSRYHGHDMMFGNDSFGGLNRAIASSLDAFQNFPFFSAVKKDIPASEV